METYTYYGTMLTMPILTMAQLDTILTMALSHHDYTHYGTDRYYTYYGYTYYAGYTYYGHAYRVALALAVSSPAKALAGVGVRVR